MEQDQTAPEKVGIAVQLLWTALGIGVLRSMMGVLLHPWIPSQALVLLAVPFILGLMWLFIYKIGRGRNWARQAVLVLFVLGIPASIPPLFSSLATDPVAGLLGIGQTVIQVVALVFLFQKASSDWFRVMKGKN